PPSVCACHLSTNTSNLSFILTFFFMLPPPPRSTLFPYTTLFRSLGLSSPAQYAAPIDVHDLSGDVPRQIGAQKHDRAGAVVGGRDRKSTRLNSSHVSISYAVFCLKKKKQSTDNSSAPNWNCCN